MQSIVYFQIFANYIYIKYCPIFDTSKLWLSPYRFFSSFIISDYDWSSITTFRARTLILHPSPRAIPQAMFVSKDAQVGTY